MPLTSVCSWNDCRGPSAYR